MSEDTPLRIYADPLHAQPVMQAHMDQLTTMLHEGEGIRDLVGRAPEVIADRSNKIRRLVANADAFDVIELLRLYILGTTVDGVRTAPAEGVAGALDIVAAIMAGRGFRLPQGDPADANPAAHIPEINTAALQLLSVSGWAKSAGAEAQPYGPLSDLAARFCQQQLTVSAINYAHVADPIEQRIFGDFDAELRRSAGFTYSDAIAVRDAIDEILRTRLNANIRAMQELTADDDDEQLSLSRQGMLAEVTRGLLVHPGKRATLTVDAVSTQARLTADVTFAVMEAFTLDFSPTDVGLGILEGHLDGSGTMRGKHLLRDDGEYLLLGTSLGTDSLSEYLEARLKSTAGKSWERFQRHRARVCEEESVRHLTRLLRNGDARANLTYYRPNPGTTAKTLAGSCADPTQYGEQAEADLLLLVEDVAICLEAKCRSISAGARAGHVQRLTRDLEDIVGSGVSQALRLEELIATNKGLWLADRSWLDLSHVAEIRSIVVSLDDIAPLAAAADQLVRAGVIAGDRFPWVVSLHDLAVIADVVDRPAEFLLYLRRRTERAVAMKYRTLDELDMFMAFLAGDLITPTDPAALHQKYPHVAAPTQEELEQYAFDTSEAFIGTYTDPLDAWQRQFEMEISEAAPKPAFQASPGTLKIVDFLLADFKPGWLRSSADLLNLSPRVQARLGHSVKQLLEATQADGRSHNLAIVQPNPWGFPLLAIFTCPARRHFPRVLDALDKYASAKAAQLGADRALGIMYSARGEIIAVRYVPDPGASGIDNVAAAAELRLDQPRPTYARLPPSARRSTRRLRAKRKRG